jgi:hypothetical protein
MTDSESTSPLRADETRLDGAYEEAPNRPSVPDAAWRRIRWLAANALERVAMREGGWAVLYRDPADGRLWELTFPQGTLLDGGPPRLETISPDGARRRYDVG